MQKVLFVCTGNVALSPMAEGIFNHHAKTKFGANRFEAVSAGFQVTEEDKAARHAVDTLDRMGIDIKHHRAKKVNREIVQEAVVVLVMSRAHKLELNKRYPHCKDKILTFHEFCGKGRTKDVEDPYGMTLHSYMESSNELNELIENLFERLQEPEFQED